MMWTLLSIFVIARRARAFDSHFFGNLIGTSTLRMRGTMSEHSGVTGKTPHQVARADSLREITDAKLVRGGSSICARTFRSSGKNDIL
jgi:hypothetical protein